MGHERTADVIGAVAQGRWGPSLGYSGPPVLDRAVYESC